MFAAAGLAFEMQAALAPPLSRGPGGALVVLDAGLADQSGIASSFADAVGTIAIEAHDDPLARVAAELGRLGGVSSIHVVTHGSPGGFTLGNTRFDGTTIDDTAAGLLAWNRLAGPGADLYLWGCDVAGGDGASLVDSIHALSGFDVAASIDVTGPAALGGDFDLEYTAGDVALPGLVAGVDVLWDTTLAPASDHTFTAASKTAMQAAFNRLNDTVAPAIKTALEGQTGSTSTDNLLQRTVGELFTDAASISPADAQALLELKAAAATYLAGGSPTLSGLAAAINTALATKATAAGAAAGSRTLTVTPSVSGNLVTLQVAITATGTTQADVNLGTDLLPSTWGKVVEKLNADYGAFFRTTPKLETGTRLTTGFTIRLDLTDAAAPTAELDIASTNLAGGIYSFGPGLRFGILDATLGGQPALPYSTTVSFGTLGASRAIADWAAPDATASSLGTPSTTLDLPITASIGGTPVTSATSKLRIVSTDPTGVVPPTITGIDLGLLPWFGNLTSDELINAVKQMGGAYEVLGTNEALTASIPFVQRKSLLDVFAFEKLFDEDIAAVIDVSVPTVMPTEAGSGLSFAVTAGGTQLTITGDKRDEFAVGQAIGLIPSTPSALDAVIRTVTIVTFMGGNTLVTINSTIDGTTTAGSVVATTPVRPDDLQTLADFQAYPAFAGLGLVPVFDATKGTVSLQFAASRSAPAAGTPTVDFNAAPLGAVTFATGAVSGTTTSKVAFGVEFDIGPANPIVFSLGSDEATGFKLSADVTLTITPVGGSATTVTVTKASTETNTSRADLVADLNAALGSSLLRARASEFETGIELYTPTVNDSMPIGITVEATRNQAAIDLGFSDGIPASDDTKDIPITLFGRPSGVTTRIVPHSDATKKFAESTLDWQLNGLSGTVGYGINTVAFATTTGDVDATYAAVLSASGGSAGDIIVDTSGLLTPTFTGGASLALKTLTRVGAATNDIAPTATITIAVDDLTAERIDSFVNIGAVLAVPGLEDSGRGTGRLAADAKVRFTSGSQTYEVTVTQASAANNTSFADLVSDFNQALNAAQRVVNGTTDTSSSFSLAGQFSFAGSGGRVSVLALESGVWYPVLENLLVPNLAAGGGETGRLTTASSLSVIRGADTYTVTVPAAETSTNTTFADLVADFNAAFAAARRRLPAQTVPNLATGGATNGRLSADVSLEISRGVDDYVVTVLAANTTGNATFADLVADFNAALETAQRQTDDGPVTADARSLLVFSPGQSGGQLDVASIEDARGLLRLATTGTAGRVQPQSLQEIANPDYATVTLPAAASMGEIGYQAGLSVQSIAGALTNANRVFDLLERDLAEYTDQEIPFIGQPLAELITLNGGLSARIQAFGKLSASSPQELERALETSLGVPASDLRITYDSVRKAYRIDFVYRASKQATVPFDVDMGVYYELLGKPLPKGVDSLTDGDGKTPLNIVVNSTSVLSVGYDLVNSKTFLYGHDGTTDHGLTNGTSFRITFSVNGQNLTFPAKFGMDVRNGSAKLENGELVVELDGPKVEKQFTGSGTTLTLASTSGLAVGMLVKGNGIPAGTRVSQVNGATQVTLSNSVTSFTGFATFTTPSSRHEIFPGSGELAALDIDNYTATFGGQARATMPIFDAFAPANLTVQSQQDMLASVDDPTRLADHPASFYLSMPDLGGYLDAVGRLAEARDAITALTNAGKTVDTAGIQLGNELDRLGFFGSEEYLRWRASWRGRLETAAEDLGGVLFAFAPELENSRNLLGAQETLVDYIRDPAMILDKLNAAISGVEGALKGLNKIPLPFMEGKLGGAVSSVFSFRTGWLLDMRNKMRGAGEGIFDVMRQSVFEYLGPKNANILLKYDPISMDRSLDSMVSATRPEDIGVVFMDKKREVLLNDVRGADAFEIVFRLGQKVFDTGIDLGFQLDALQSVGIGAAFDGGLRLQVGWEMLLGFGFSITDGFYLKVDSTGDAGSRGNFSGSTGQFEAQLRFDATLTGASKDYTQRWDAGGQYWKIVDTKGTAVTTDDTDVIDATTGQAYRAIAVNNQATDVTALVSTEPAEYDPCGCGEQPSSTRSGQKIWWVVGTDSGNGSFVPAELNDQGMYVPQTSPYAHTLIEVTAMKPAQLAGSLFFLRLAATDKIRRGLSGFTDVDSQYFYDASDGPQVTADQRDNEATGVNRNNELPTRFSAAVGLNMVDPSASAGRNTVREWAQAPAGAGTKRVVDPTGKLVEGNSGAIAKPGTVWAYAPLFWQQSEIPGVYAKEYYAFKLKVAPPSKYDALDFPVRVATGGNVALRGMGIIDGVQLKVGDRVLVKSQSLAEENGIYTVSPGGWSRAFDADANAEFNTGSGKPMFVMVEEGRSNAGTGWNLRDDTGNVTLGTTPLYYEKTMVAIREPLPKGLYMTRLVPYEPFVVLPIRADLIDQAQSGGKINIQVEYDQRNYFVTLDTSAGGTGAALRAAQLNQALAQAVPAQLNASGDVEAVPGNTSTFNLAQAGFTFVTPGEADKKWYRIEFARLKEVDGIVSRQATRSGTFIDYGTPDALGSIGTQKGWDPVADINADASPGRITWRELKSAGFKKTFQVDFHADAVANLTMELSVGDTASSPNLSIPRIFADFNLDWSTRAARARIEKAKTDVKDQTQAQTQGTTQQPADDDYSDSLIQMFGDEEEAVKSANTGGDKGIDPASPLLKEMDLKPEIGFNNIRLDVGSFLTKFIKPAVEEAEPYLSKVRPALQFFNSRIPVLSDVAGRTIKVVDLLEAYGGPKGKTVRAVIDVVTAVDNLVARIAALPPGVNVQIPMGRFWFPKQFGDVAALNGAPPAPGAQYKYGDLVYDNLALGKRASGFYGGNNSTANADAKAAIDALKATNPDSNEQKKKQGFISNNAADRGGIRVPLLDDPLNLFQLMMGKTATLVTYQLPKLQYEFEKEIPLLKIVCFEVGLRASFELNSNLAFGFDTYGINQYMVSGDIADIAQGFYVSDRANADGTGADVPEFQAIASFGLYGGINLVLAKGGIEGGLRFVGEVNLNDPNNDGKLRLTEAIGIVVDTGNPLDVFDLSFRGEVYARYYYKVGIGKLAIKGGKTFARIELFNLVREGNDGAPIFASRLDGTEGDAVPGTLLIHVGEAAPKRVSNQDPLNAKDGSERYKIWSSGSTVYVQYLNYSESTTKEWAGVTQVVFEGGLGNDELDASGLDGIPLFFKGGDGNDSVTLGSGHGSTVSRIEGEDGNDTIVVIGGGIVDLVGGVGNDILTGGTGVVRIEAGEGNDSVTTRAGSTSTIVMAEDYGLDTAVLAAAALQNLLDFTSLVSAIELLLDGALGATADGTATAGEKNKLTFNVGGATEIRGSTQADTFTVRNPRTRNAVRSGSNMNGLLLRGGQGDDLYDFLLDTFASIAADGILIDDVQAITPAVAGTVTRCGSCNKIESIAVQSGGEGYELPPQVMIVDPTGSGAQAVAVLDERGRVVSIQIIDGGEGYTDPRVTLIAPRSLGDKLVITRNVPGTATLYDPTPLASQSTQYGYSIDGSGRGPLVRFVGWGDGVRPDGFDQSEIDSVTVNMPEGVLDLTTRINLFQTFTVDASRMSQNARIVADTVEITTDHGFQVKHPIHTVNSGDVTIRVTGDGTSTGEGSDLNAPENRATATAVVSAGGVASLALTNAGDNYFFTPSITVGADGVTPGTGARFAATLAGNGGGLSGFTQLAPGSGYYSSPAPVVVVPPPASIQIDAMITSSLPNFYRSFGAGNGRGRIVLFADTGAVSTSGEVFFPEDARPGSPQGSRTIDWIGGDFRYRSTVGLDDLVSPTQYPGITVGTGAEFTANLDADGRVVGFTKVSGGSGYSQDLPPLVEIEGLATAVPVIGSNGELVGLAVTYPGDGYGQPPRVTIRPNGFGRIVNSPNGVGSGMSADGVTPMNRVHIRALGGTLVAVAGAGVGDPLKPLKSDVEKFVAQVTATGGVHVLEKDGLRIGKDQSVSGVSTVNGDVSITTFGGTLELGAPRQALDEEGRPLWQDAAKTIPIYDRDPVTGRIIYEGGDIAVGSGDVKLTADDVEVNVDMNSSGGSGTITLQPVRVDAEIGLAGTRARIEGVVTDGRLTGFDATKFWGGRGYTTAPLVIVDPAGQRAYAAAVVEAGAVTAIEIIFGGTNYDPANPPTVTLSGGGISNNTPTNPATATAIVGDDGVISGFTITNAGSGYVTSPNVSIASPGQALVQAVLDTANPDPVTGRFAVKEFVITNAGRNYQAAPSIEVAAPYEFTLDADEVDKFAQSFTQVVIGRIEGQHLFHSPEAAFDGAVVLRAPRSGGTLDVASFTTSGPVSIVGSGNTFHFDSANASISGTSISIDDNVIVHAGVAGSATASTGSIVVFGTGKGMIDGDPTGDDVGDDEDLTLAAHTFVTVTGAIGGRWKLDDLTVTSATRGAVDLQQSVTLTGDLDITGGAITIGGVIDVDGDLVIDASSMVLFSANVRVGGDLTITGATGVTFAGTLTVGGSLNIGQTPGTVRFGSLVSVTGPLEVTAGTLIEVLGGLMAGDATTFTANEVEFKGGTGSITGVATQTLTVRPFAPSRPIRVGTPTGSSSGTLDVSDTDLAAIAGGWAGVVIGDAAAGTGAVTVGSIGTQQGSRNSWLANPTTIVGGSVTVAQKVDAAIPAGELLLRARTGDVTVNAAINETATDRSATVSMRAAGAIAINAAVSSAQAVNLISGGTTSQTTVAPLATRNLRIDSQGAVSLLSPTNAFELLAVVTSDDDISIREDSGYEIGFIDGVIGVRVGTGTARLISSGRVTQAYAIDAARLDLQGAGGQWVLTAGNTIGTLTADTGSLNVSDAAQLNVGSLVSSQQGGTAIALSAPTGLALTAAITTAGGDVVLNDAVTLTNDVTIDVEDGANKGTARFLSTVNATTAGQQALAITGSLNAAASIGGSTSPDGALKSLAVSGGSTLAGGSTVRTTGGQTYSGGATSSGTVTVQAGSGAAVRFLGATALGGLVTSTTDTAAYDVELSGASVTVTNPVTFANTGTVTLGDQATDDLHLVGGVTSTAPATTKLAGTIRTTDAAGSFGRKPGGVIQLLADTIVSTGTGRATFSGTVDGAHRLVVNAAGDTTFSSAVGGGTALTHLETDAPGRTLLDGGSVRTASPTSQRYNDAVLLGANTTLTAANGGAVTFATTLDGGYTLAVNTAGVTTFGGAVGGTTALVSLTTDAGGTTAVNGGAVTTTGGQTYDDAVSLGANTTLAGSALTFATTLDGAFALAVNAQGQTRFGGPVGGTTALASLTTDAGGSTAINGGAVTTTGGQTYNDAVSLGANTTLAGSALTFATTLDGAFALAANAQGQTTFGGPVGGTTALASLTTDAGGSTAINGGAVTTTGGQTYNDAVSLGSNTTVAGGTITFATTLDGAFTLAANAQGQTRFGGLVGGTTPLAGVTTDAGGTTRIDGGAVRTSGSQTWLDDVTLTSDTAFTSSAGSINAGPANVFQATGRDVSFTAATGIGTAAAPIRIAAAEVTAEVTGSGGIHIVGVGDLVIGSAGLQAPGMIGLDASGLIRVPDGGRILAGAGVTAGKPIHWSVFTTADSGTGSLRQAIVNANAVGNANAAGRDAVVAFSGLPNPAVFVLQAQLPTIGVNMAIDGAAGVVIDGNRAVQDGLTFGAQAAGSLLKGVTLANFTHFGIQLLAAPGVTVDGVTVRSLNTETSMGLYATGDLAGTTVVSSTFSGGLRGALLDNARNLIFGQIGKGNVLSNNLAAPTNRAYAGTGIRAQGLLTGTVVTGNTFTGNNYGFAFIGANNLRLDRNTFTRNSVAGIYIEGDSRGSSHTGSLFGTARPDRNKANIVRARKSSFGGQPIPAVAQGQVAVVQKKK